MQGVSIVGEKEKSNICGKATKNTVKGKASMPYRGKSTGRRDEVEENKGGRDGICGQAMKSIATVEEKPGSGVEEESRGTLWEGSTGGSTPIRTRMVHE